MTETGEGVDVLRERISRRAMMKGLAVAVVGSQLAPLGRHAAPLRTSRRVAPLSQAAFAAHRGDIFHVRAGASRRVAVRLVDVVDRGRYATRPAGECFAVLFRGPRSAPLPQETYTFTHDHMGSFALFIVPGASDADGIRYEALFNRLPV